MQDIEPRFLAENGFRQFDLAGVSRGQGFDLNLHVPQASVFSVVSSATVSATCGATSSLATADIFSEAG